MSALEIGLLSLALAADAFSVATAIGLTAHTRRQVFRLSFHFGLFQALMPALGAFLGIYLREWVQSYDHWVAFGLLQIIGVRMIVESLRPKTEDPASTKPDPTTGLSLAGLSLAVSIDALGAGVGMAMTMSTMRLVIACLVIGAVCSLITWLGMRAGRVFQLRLGRRVETVGGSVLVLLGVKMLFT